MSLRLLRVLPLLALLLAGCTPKIGNKCTLSTDCSQLGDRLCDTTQPDGYCTVFNCEPDQCPNAICVAFDPILDPACGASVDGRWPRFERSFCLAPCNSDSDCRDQYQCIDLYYQVNQTARSAQVVDLGADDGGLGYKVCMASTCGDGIKDGTETDIDCGGSVCLGCGSREHCNTGSDCLSGTCGNGICLGSQACKTNGECQSGVCNLTDINGVCPVGGNCTCAGTNCTDKKQDGAETDVDCGGPDCAPCVSTATVSRQCQTGTDCASDLCHTKMGNACVACVTDNDCAHQSVPTCANGVCGGPCVCDPGDCTNGKKDGAETSVDCGGGGCPACQLSQACVDDADCASSTCGQGTCVTTQACEKDTDCPMSTSSCIQGQSGRFCSTKGQPQPPCRADADCEPGDAGAGNFSCSAKTCLIPPVCLVPDAGAPWTPYMPDAGADAGPSDAGPSDAGADADGG